MPPSADTRPYRDEDPEEGLLISLEPEPEDNGVEDSEELASSGRKNILVRHLPPRARKAWEATVKWTAGPQPPRIWQVQPIFESVQTAPIRALDKLFPKTRHKFCLLVAYLALWFFVFSAVLRRSAFDADVPGYGAPSNIGCGARFWFVAPF